MPDFKKDVAKVLEGKAGSLGYEEIYQMIELPKDTQMGDFAFPCFRLAKELRKGPPIIAKELTESIVDMGIFETIEPISGYVNFKVKRDEFARSVINECLEKDEKFGHSDMGKGEKVLVEFSSTNIAKPFHIGHIRSTMIGNSLYKIYKALGYDTVAINHLGDYGTQFGKLIVAYKKWGDHSTVEKNPIPELQKLYVRYHEEAKEEPSLDDEAREWFKSLEEGDKEAVELWSWFREVSLKEFDRVYEKLGVHFDSYAGESFYSDKMPGVIKEMEEKGILKDSEGARIVDLEEYGMPPALITKSDGSSLYITRDIAAGIYRKNHYDFTKNIYVVGAAQKLHFQQWFKVVELMGYDWVKDCEHVEFGMVSLEDGALSTRGGRVVYLEDVLDSATEKTLAIMNEKNPNLENKEQIAADVGIGAVVFQELQNNRIKDYTFSWEKTLSFDGETGPYVQYTHARGCSVLRKYEGDFENIDFRLLTDDASLDVIRFLNRFPDVVVDAAKKNEPSLVTRYIVDLSQLFNRFYHDNPILVNDANLSKARASVVKSVTITLRNGLTLIGIKYPEKM